jgi:hypothetical protein
MALPINSTIFCPVTPCSLETAPIFGVSYRIVSQRRGDNSVVLVVSFCSFLNLLFDPEDWGVIFLRNVGLSHNYTLLQPKIGTTWLRENNQNKLTLVFTSHSEVNALKCVSRLLFLSDSLNLDIDKASGSWSIFIKRPRRVTPINHRAGVMSVSPACRSGFPVFPTVA